LVGFHDLQVLNLANCLLESIIAADFGDLKQLRVLVLSHNRLSSLGISPQLHSMQLSSLDVHGNDIKLLENDVDILRESSLKIMRAETSDAILCALSGTRISFKTKISRSVLCLRLIPKYEMRVIVASIMTAIAVLNGGVIIWRCNLQKQNVVSSYLVITAMLNISCGVHLGIILLADKLYARHFYVHREAWRASRLCQVSLLITHLESQLTTAIAALVTWEKHKAVSSLQKSRGRKGPLLLAVLATLTLTASALHLLDLTTIHEASDFCYAPLYDSTSLTSRWYGKIQLNGVKPVLLFAQWALSGLILYRVKRQEQQTKGRVSGGEDFSQIALTLIMLALVSTHQLALEMTCLIQSESGSLLALLSCNYLRAVLNPFVHTFLTKQFRSWMKKHLKICN
jgi:hypothetical protein